jgi:hypothetical protein
MELLSKSSINKIINAPMTIEEMQNDGLIKNGAYNIWLRYYKKKFINDKMQILVKVKSEFTQVVPPSYLDYRTEKKISASWLKSVREALFLSAASVSLNMNCKRTAFTQIEQQEIKGAITLNKLKEAAAALDCDLVYGLVPKKHLLPSEQVWETLYPPACRVKFVENVTREQRMHGIASAARSLMEDLNFRTQSGWSTRSEVSDFGEFRKLSRLDAEKLMKAEDSK